MPATMKTPAYFRRSSPWICAPRLERAATDAAGLAGAHDMLPRTWPNAVGAMSTIETRPGMRVVGEVRSPW